jgi:hypothetical protein
VSADSPATATYTKDHTTMANPPTTRARARWHVDRATSLPEIWACIAVWAGLVGAWRLTGVCKAARAGVQEYLGTLPGLVVVYGGGTLAAGMSSNVWRLDLVLLRWAPMPSTELALSENTCCVVRRSVAVIGRVVGGVAGGTATSSVEVLSPGQGAAFTSLPPLSCGELNGAAAIAVEESHSAAGQVLLLGGVDPSHHIMSTVQLVDLATGVCTLQPPLLHARACLAAARLPDGRVVCTGGFGGGVVSSTEVWGPPQQGAHTTAWTWTQLPNMSVVRYNCSGCVMSDGRFAVLGGAGPTSSCEALTLGDGAHWRPLPSMHDSRQGFACTAVAGCIIVAGGQHRQSAEVFDEALGRWLRLPHDLPYVGRQGMSSALL